VLLDLINGKNPESRGPRLEASARRLLPTVPRERKQDLVRKLHRYLDFDTRRSAWRCSAATGRMWRVPDRAVPTEVVHLLCS
jgi:hypothetical protein